MSLQTDEDSIAQTANASVPYHSLSRVVHSTSVSVSGLKTVGTYQYRALNKGRRVCGRSGPLL